MQEYNNFKLRTLAPTTEISLFNNSLLRYRLRFQLCNNLVRIIDFNKLNQRQVYFQARKDILTLWMKYLCDYFHGRSKLSSSEALKCILRCVLSGQDKHTRERQGSTIKAVQFCHIYVWTHYKHIAFQSKTVNNIIISNE